MKSTQELEKLEALIETLENPDLDLDEAVEIYGKALKSAEALIKSIKTTEKKLFILNEQAEELLSKNQ
jgi:exodeoxyribonuclease VII small subunit